MSTRRMAMEQLGALLQAVCALDSRNYRPARTLIRLRRCSNRIDLILERRTNPSKLASRLLAVEARLRVLLDEVAGYCARPEVDETNQSDVTEACENVMRRVSADIAAALKAADLARPSAKKLSSKTNGASNQQSRRTSLASVASSGKKRRSSEAISVPIKRARSDSSVEPRSSTEFRSSTDYRTSNDYRTSTEYRTSGEYLAPHAHSPLNDRRPSLATSERRPSTASSSTPISPSHPDKLKALTDAELLRTLALHPERVLRPGQTVLGVVDHIMNEAANLDPATLTLTDWRLTKRKLWAMSETIMPERGPLLHARTNVQRRFLEEMGHPQTDMNSMVELLAQLCAPARDPEVAKITHLLANNQLEASLQLIVILLTSMRTDLLQFQAQAMTKGGQISIEHVVRITAQQKERLAIVNIWGDQQRLLGRLSYWVARNGGGDLLSALLEALLSPKPPVMPSMTGHDPDDALPAILVLAAQEIFGLQNFLQAILILASLHAASGAKASTDLNRLWVLLQAEIQRSVQDPSRTSAGHLAAELGMEQAAVTQILRGYDDPIYRLLASRLKSGLADYVRAEPPVPVAPTAMQTGQPGAAIAAAGSPVPAPLPIIRIPGLLDEVIADKITQAAIGIRELFRWTFETWMTS